MPKRKSSIKKGGALEKLVKEELVRILPWVEGPPIKTAWARRDYFGLFDFMVLLPTGRVLGIQVSTRPIYDKGRDFKHRWTSWSGLKLYVSSIDGLAEKIAEISSDAKLELL